MGNKGQRHEATKVKVHGRTRWKVEIRHDGRRIRRFYPTREEAQAAAAAAEAERSAFGRIVTSWTPSERVAIAAALEELRDAGATIHDAMRSWRDNRIAPKTARTSPRLRDAREEFTRAKAGASRRPRYLQELRHVLSWLDPVALERVDAIATPVLEAILAKRQPAPWTGRGVIAKWRGFWAWAIRRGYATQNPAAALDLPALEDRPPCILTPDQAGALLEAARRHVPELLAFLALQMFGGIRPAEVDRLPWTDVRDGAIAIEGRTSKTRKRRLVPILDTLAAWLAIAPRIGAGPRPPGFRRAWLKLRRLAPVPWGHDILRHSFVSYHLEAFGDAGRTALIAGHRQEVLFQHYRERVTPAAAAAWWAIRPSAPAPAAPPAA